MTPQRFAFAVIIIVQGTLAAAVQQELLSGKALAWASLACTALAGVLRVLPPLDAPAKAPSVPPLPILLLALVLVGCSGARRVEAEATYGAQLLACVDQHATRQDIDACRAKVDAKWGQIDSGIVVVESAAKDGGGK